MEARTKPIGLFHRPVRLDSRRVPIHPKLHYMNAPVERRAKHTNYFDLWMIGISMVLALFFAVLLYGYEKWILDPEIKGKAKRESMAKVTKSIRSNKRRYAGSLTYLDINSGDSIFLGDTLFVSKDASLDLKLPTGADLRLGALTLVLVDRENNQVKFILNNGEINATMTKDEILRFEVEEELLTVEGTKGSRFKIKLQDFGPSKLEAKDKPIKVSYKDQSFELTNNELDLTNNKSKAPPPPPPKETVPPEALKKPLVLDNVKEEPVAPEDVPLDIPIPFPTDKQLFLIKKKASVIILPKRLCASPCVLKLFRGESPIGNWNFKEKEAPLVKFAVTPKEQGEYKVILTEEAAPPSPTTPSAPASETTFQVEVFSAAIFEKAIKAGRSVELLD